MPHQQQYPKSWLNSTSRPKYASVAYILLFLFGIIGGHKFYLRQYVWGAIYIVCNIFFWTMIWHSWVGLVFPALLIVMLIVDVFSLPIQVRETNEHISITLHTFPIE